MVSVIRAMYEDVTIKVKLNGRESKAFNVNPLTSMGRFRPTRIDLQTDPISPRRPAVSAGLHAADTLWHACIDFLTYSDDHPCR